MGQLSEPAQINRISEPKAPQDTRGSSGHFAPFRPRGESVTALADRPSGDQGKLASDQILSGRGNGATHALIMRRLQQGIGNARTQQLIAQRQASSRSPSVMQRQAEGSARHSAIADSAMIPSSSMGEPIDRPTREFMEPRFGADLSEVRVHTDTAAVGSADALSANAYTVGRDIYFAAGKYAPASPDGRNLLAHEMAHVLQQRSSQTSSIATKPSGGMRVSAPNDQLEVEAQQAADSVTGSAIVDPRALSSLSSPAVQRAPAPDPVQGAVPAPAENQPAQQPTLPPGSIFAGDSLDRYSRLKSGISAEQWKWLSNAAKARAMSQRIRAGSGDAAERDRLAADGMASLDVPVASLLATPPLMSAPQDWKLLAFQAAAGGDTSAAGNALRNSVIARWLSAFSDTGGATVQVSLIDPDGIGPDFATLTFQYAGRPLSTSDGTITLGEIDQAGLQAVLASFSPDLAEVGAFEQLIASVNAAIDQGRTMIQAGHAGFSADDVTQWSSVLTQVQGSVAAFQSAHPDANQSTQTVSATLNAFISSEATPFATDHRAFLRQNQPSKSWGEETNERVDSQMKGVDKLMQSDSFWDHLAIGANVEGASETAAPYGMADFFSGGNLEASRQFHQAFRDGHISLEAFEAGSAAAARRGEMIGAANAILMIASFGLASPILGAAPSTLAVVGYGGASAALSTAIPMTISSLYTRSVDMKDPYSAAIWSPGAYTPGQIAISSGVAFGIGAGLGAISRIGARMPESSMQELVVASMQGRSLQTIPGLLVEDLGPGLVRLTIEGEPGYVELTREGFIAYAPAGPGRTPTIVHTAQWVEPIFPRGAIAENPFLANVQGNASYVNAQSGQGMMFGVTPEGYFAYAPRTSTPFVESSFPVGGNTGAVAPPGVAPLELPLLGTGAAVEPVPLVHGPDPAGAAAATLAEVQTATTGLPIESQLRISRALSLLPHLRSTPRATGEIELILSKAGLSLQPPEVQALRAMGYQGAVVPPTSRASLDAFLHSVWEHRQAILAKQSSTYNLYSGAGQTNPLTETPQQYMSDLAAIAQQRPGGAVSHIQGVTSPRPGDQITSALASQRPDLGRKFFMFFRSGTIRNESIVEAVSERIYLDIRADQATRVMQHIVAGVIDNPVGFPRIVAAKLTGPTGVQKRVDAIVIYGQDQAAMASVLDWVRNYQSSNPAAFGLATPPMTEQVLPGVGVGSEPLPRHGGESFGGLRTSLIENALRQTMASSGTQIEFERLVDEAFRSAGINAEQPHLNAKSEPQQ